MMANMTFRQHFTQNLKKHYSDKLYSDVTLNIVEEKRSQVQLQDGSDEQSSKIIKAHKIILDINSPYFEGLLANHKEGSSELEIKVKEGEGKYVEFIISSFYDKNVISDLPITDLIRILELAVTYASEKLMKHIVSLLETLQPDGFETSTFVLGTIFSIEDSVSIMMNAELRSVGLKYACFLAKVFAPIEEKKEEHKRFLFLGYSSLLHMLRGDEPIALSENSLLVFVIDWLEFDTTRQTASIIEGLLTNIRVKCLNGKLLHSGITMNHSILSKWDGFHSWIFNCLGFHALSKNEKVISDLGKQKSRNIGIHKWYTSKSEQNLGAIRWLIHMTPVEGENRKRKEGKMFVPATEHHHDLVHDGMKFSPKTITITKVGDNTSNYDMSLTITCSYSMFGIRLVLGIVPADRAYDITEVYFHSVFARSLLKWTEPPLVETSFQVFDYWTVSKDFVDLVNKNGLYVCLLPITEAEYTNLTEWRFLPICKEGFVYKKNNNCYNNCYHIVVGDNQCGANGSCYATSRLPKINLDALTNFTV